MLQAEMNQLEETKADMEQRGIDIDEGEILLQRIAKEAQDGLVFMVEDVVQSALNSVFPHMYKFILSFSIARGKSAAVITLMDNLGNEVDPMESNGGGIVDVVSFALRVAMVTLASEEKTMILDEPFKWISSGYKEAAGDMLKALADQMGIQFIVVTHDDVIIEAADRVFRSKVNKETGVAKVTTVEL